MGVAFLLFALYSPYTTSERGRGTTYHDHEGKQVEAWRYHALRNETDAHAAAAGVEGVWDGRLAVDMAEGGASARGARGTDGAEAIGGAPGTPARPDS